MRVQQTIFNDDGAPLGTATIDGITGLVTFQPRDGSTELTRRTWRSMEALKLAVLREWGGGLLWNFSARGPVRAPALSLIAKI